MGKNISIGIGISKDDDSYRAAHKASTEAAKQVTSEAGAEPKFSIVYVDSSLEPKEVLKGVNDVLGKNWVGVSTDKIFNSIAGYDPDVKVAVMSIQSEYMHFKVSVADNYRKNPKKKANDAVREAMEDAKGDTELDAYIQFTRTKKKGYGNIVRTPPYFILTYISGVQVVKGKTIPGNESEFLSGIVEYTGPGIPVFGGSASSSLEEYMEGKAENYQYANGNLYSDAAIIIFIVCNLHFSTLVMHGYKMTKDFVAITRIGKSGYQILELNGKEPITEYARILGVSKEEYLKDPENFSFSRPFGLILEDGTSVIKEAVPNPDKKTLNANFRMHENTMMNILEIDKAKTLETQKDSVDKMIADKKNNQNPFLAMFCSCSGRRILLDGVEKSNIDSLIKKYKKLAFFGFYSFGEVGSTQSASAMVHSQTVTSLLLYDNLLST